MGVVGVLAAGCTADLDPTSDDPTLTPSGSPTTASATPGQEVDSDVAVLDAAAEAVSQAHHLVRRHLRRYPGQRAVLAPLERLHRVHARELGGLRPVTGGGTVPSVQVLGRVAREEAALQRTLTRRATEARSGALALLLASMAAGVAQHRTTLPSKGA